MLRKETVEQGTLDLINTLMADERLKKFNLVGGTALALKMGHRTSVDIDLFTDKPFNTQELANHLATTYNVLKINTLTNGIFCVIDGIKVDVLAHQYPLIGNVETMEGIRMVSLEDIGAMKLHAIYSNGTRLKDFVDMHALLERLPLQKMLDTAAQKYPENNMAMVKNALLHHADIKFSEPIDYIGKVIEWAVIAERLLKAVHFPYITFGPSGKIILANKNKPKLRQKKRKGRRL